ncbi:hypothetical protein GGS20DRAFT_554022 [Poronia punctata]|nr:hypothetical protein GGS20DRAFT_554022 [Poronia punctata]
MSIIDVRPNQAESLGDLLHKRTIPNILDTLQRIVDNAGPAIVEKSSQGMTVSVLQLCAASSFSAERQLAFHRKEDMGGLSQSTRLFHGMGTYQLEI